MTSTDEPYAMPSNSENPSSGLRHEPKPLVTVIVTRCMKSSVSWVRGWKTADSITRSNGRGMISPMTLGSQQAAWLIQKKLWRHMRKISPRARSKESRRRWCRYFANLRTSNIRERMRFRIPKQCTTTHASDQEE